MSVLEASSLTLGCSDTIIIEDLDLKIPTGEITVFIGTNGCGKSTLLRSIARLLKPKSGQVLLGGDVVGNLSTKKVAKRLAVLPQGPIAYVFHTVRGDGLGEMKSIGGLSHYPNQKN
jgi:iron complex transport system ATP-binding protein